MYFISALITSTIDPSKRYTRHDHVGRMARSLCRHTGRADGKKSSMGSENRRRRFRGNLKSSVTRSIAPERAALENRRYLPKRLLLPQSSQRDADGGAERLRVLNEFRDLRSQTWGELTVPWRTSDTSLSTFGDSRSPSSSSCRRSSCVPAQTPCHPSNVIVTSVSL